MAKFELYYPKQSKNEGGYASAKLAASIGDSGGETYRGIARNYNKDWAGWPIIDAYIAKNGAPKWNSIIPDDKLNKMVVEHSKTAYWDNLRLDDVKNQSLAELIGDFGFNSGLGTVARIVQRLLTITADGKIGNATIKAINAANQKQLFDSLKAARIHLIENSNKIKNSVKPQLIDRTNDFFFHQSENTVD